MPEGDNTVYVMEAYIWKSGICQQIKIILAKPVDVPCGSGLHVGGIRSVTTSCKTDCNSNFYHCIRKY